MHHGILGQKWGIRRFQPYGQGYDSQNKGRFVGDSRSASKSKKSTWSIHEGPKESMHKEKDEHLGKYGVSMAFVAGAQEAANDYFNTYYSTYDEDGELETDGSDDEDISDEEAESRALICMAHVLDTYLNDTTSPFVTYLYNKDYTTDAEYAKIAADLYSRAYKDCLAIFKNNKKVTAALKDKDVVKRMIDTVKKEVKYWIKDDTNRNKKKPSETLYDQRRRKRTDYTDTEGNIAVGNNGKGVTVRKNNSYEDIKKQYPNLPANAINAILKSRQGNSGIARTNTYGGVQVYKGATRDEIKKAYPGLSPQGVDEMYKALQDVSRTKKK